MRFLLLATSVLAIALIAFFGFRLWQSSSRWPRVSAEVVQLTPEKRLLLQRLRAENKFQPNNYPPLGYTGAATPEDQARANGAVNGVINGVLAYPDGPVQAKAVSHLIRDRMKTVALLETEIGTEPQVIWWRFGTSWGSRGRPAGSRTVPPSPYPTVTASHCRRVGPRQTSHGPSDRRSGWQIRVEPATANGEIRRQRQCRLMAHSHRVGSHGSGRQSRRSELPHRWIAGSSLSRTFSQAPLRSWACETPWTPMSPTT